MWPEERKVALELPEEEELVERGSPFHRSARWEGPAPRFGHLAMPAC